MNFSTLKQAFHAVVSDRMIQAGVPTGTATIWGGIHLPPKEWVAYYATAAGAMLTTLMIIIAVIRIVRMIKNPKVTE